MSQVIVVRWFVAVIFLVVAMLVLLNPNPVSSPRAQHPNDYPSSYDPYLEN